MTSAIINFFHMGGYGIYIWSSYGCVLVFLAVQWLLPWRRWRKYLKERA